MNLISMRTLLTATTLALIVGSGQTAFAVSLADLKPQYAPVMPKPDLSRPMPPAPRMQPRPEASIGYGNTLGVAPTLTVPLRNGGQVELKGPDLHPQVLPTINGGSVTLTVPLPEGKKK